MAAESPCIDVDWREAKPQLFMTLSTLLDKVNGLHDDVDELRVDVGVIKSSIANQLCEEDIEEIVEKAVLHKQNGRSTAELTRDEIRKMVQEVREVRNGASKSNGSSKDWEPWKYVVLGGVFGFGSNVFLKAVEIIAK